MDKNEKVAIMVDTTQQLVDMIQKRMNNRLNALNAIQTSALDNLPDEVKQMREVEASRIRAVMQEQADLIEIMQMLYPKNAVKVK